ncbi:MAG: bifunctional demethylmenaquinone methyltransferase/2-methoxy-6-polyprenyl-1,4-benzoquinol methylase UbiE [Candidatus Tectomicrobia bacterium]|uniref:Demethylmenaquinone methyltransferase n=1 Tax=Tectimicrobiota bacterium TaxID=2528274 RepID=A0A932CQT5_UNCTE|nr:bifunctional demethylmenaquinone methyltransferase/2-methoxy-6-polyprenyl-1,4-benzoquinol methylase UbiE [Candidatus Tectomicrobia bacterium]
MELKKDEALVQQIFSSIAGRYDLLNFLLSLGIDRHWRTRAIQEIPPREQGLFLDIATGTGDVALALARHQPPSARIWGVDFSHEMLALARRKVARHRMEGRIHLQLGNALALPFRDGTFDAISIAFGLRNLSDLQRGLQEMCRVLCPGGKVVILEFCDPPGWLFRRLYYGYFCRILPVVGGVISGNGRAYRYLRDSVLAFPDPEWLQREIERAGFCEVGYRHLTGGIAAIHVGRARL